MEETSIVLADDHHLVRQALRTLLEAESDFAVVGEAGDGVEAAALIERRKPDVLLLDLMIPGLGGLEVLRQVRRRSPETRVIILSMHGDEAYVVEALRQGALGYVLKCATAAALVTAIREAMAGRRYLSPPLSERAIASYRARTKGAPLNHYEMLTAREREVLLLTAEGQTSSEIGLRLVISPRTVEIHRARAMHKLDLRNRAELIRYVVERGLLTPKT